MSIRFLAKSTIFTVLISSAAFAAPNDGIPDPSKTDFFTINLCFTKDSGEVVCQSETLPELIRDFGKVGRFAQSPVDRARVLADIPTFALAKYHHWIFGNDVLARAQRQYQNCIGRIRAYQELLGIKPVIDASNSPELPVVRAVSEYIIPMDVVQRLDGGTFIPPTKADAIAHASAAIDTINATVAFRINCDMRARELKNRVLRKLNR